MQIKGTATPEINQQDYEFGMRIAKQLLLFHVSRGAEGTLIFTMKDISYASVAQTEAGAMEEFSHLFTIVTECMWDIINFQLAKWVVDNKEELKAKYQIQ